MQKKTTKATCFKSIFKFLSIFEESFLSNFVKNYAFKMQDAAFIFNAVLLTRKIHRRSLI